MGIDSNKKINLLVTLKKRHEVYTHHGSMDK
uniref:Uncharacterized protein n=1 Tax=Siphoviridae sp. ctitf6 TaxID=2825627 RepID=A0A8S5P364_9CAUD|nr:MAG TPA: hypothetical protein [Siphoviridae sp. ctitf6]